jgi:hypothetical protein
VKVADRIAKRSLFLAVRLIGSIQTPFLWYRRSSWDATLLHARLHVGGIRGLCRAMSLVDLLSQILSGMWLSSVFYASLSKFKLAQIWVWAVVQ